ncbi:p53 apoptosis effector related to PMP-22 [Rhincodon typus]|uniref:p53 apoptosis effector related to PMP-22 n=1 Tax=Rhincodon typus TaxID=259920 RepID=UPI00202F3609|nr:p53 apoptosis effector related to PMP-22 [Rhincodon typus]
MLLLICDLWVFQHRGSFVNIFFVGPLCFINVRLPANNFSSSFIPPGWAKASAALLIIGCILLIICFILSFLALCKEQSGLLRVIGVILFVAVLFQFIALIVYPVNFTKTLIQNGNYEYSWSYGFGWGATILMIGCGIFFCCLPKYEDELYGQAKPIYIYG